MIRFLNKIRKIDLFKIKLSGVIIFGIIPYIKTYPELIKSKLESTKEELEQIKLKYSNIELKSVLNDRNVRIEIFTSNSIYSFDSDFVHNFITELNILFKKIDSDTFIKQISLNGSIKTVSYENNFEVNFENDELNIIDNYKYRKILGLLTKE